MQASQKQPFMLGEWRIDPQADVIARGDSTIKLVPKTMEVLGYLAQRAGEVVSQDDIEAAVWRDVVVTSSSVYQAIGDLRRALGDDKRESQYIVTVPRKGYRLIAPVRSAVDDAAQSRAPAVGGPAQQTDRPEKVPTHCGADRCGRRRRRSDPDVDASRRRARPWC